MKKLIFFLIVFYLFSSSFIIYTTKPKYIFQNNYGENNRVKTSDNEISIITPENKTYAKPMSGYYPGTYGFENDELNTLAQEWTTIISQGTDAFVTQSFINHYSVFQIYDTTASHSITIYNYFTSQNFGTIEMWCAVDDNSQPSSLTFNIRDDSNTYGPEIKLRYGNFIYNDGNFHDIVSASSNQWYHIRLDFRCTGASAYEGLNENHYFLYINGIKYGEFPFLNNISNATLLTIGVGHVAINNAYIDAVGYSWDPYYTIGDNLNEGLLLSFDNSTTLDWMGYSLDGHTNKTILGNTVIPLPEEGSHHIQVFGNDTSGKSYESLVRYFSYFYFEIITPEDKIYTEPMLGYYPATYGFENDIIGYNPSGWQVNENPPAYDIDVVKEKNSHKHVVHINDNEIGGYRMRYFPDSDIEIGTIELWVLGVNVSDTALEISSLDNSSITGITLRLHTNGWYYYGKYGDQLISNASIPQDNQWHHIRLDFRCSGTADYMGLTESSYRVYIDGINLGELSFCEPYFDKLNSFIITTDNISDSEWWVDAIGFSWDPNYNIGDNLNEGLLLSFETHLSLNWIGYSLDGQANKTIQGNKTISLPENGLHKIQFYCELPTGELIESNVRHFTINHNPEEPYIPPYELPNDFHILITVFIGALSIFLGVLLILYVILSRRRKYELFKFKEPKKPEILVKPKSGYLICPYCHNGNSIKNNYCIYCGASLLEFKPDNI